MSGFRGRAIIYPLLLLAGWAVGRTAMLLRVDTAETTAPVYRAQTRDNSLKPFAPIPPTALRQQPVRTGLSHHGGNGWKGHPAAASYRALLPDRGQHPRIGSPPVAMVPQANGEVLDGQGGQAADAKNSPGLAGPQNSRWFGYAYSFWRITDKRGVITAAPAAQYGGSQSGFIMGYDLGGTRDRGLALVARGAVAPDRGGEEVAFGLRWRRPAALPLSLTAERRFLLNGRDRWAAYAAGGVDAIRLPARFSLDAYGQAGWATGKDGGGFYDAQARATRKLADVAGASIRAGVGAWAGGQEGVQRFDIGPTVATEFPVGKTNLNLRLDWRQRVAANAAPSRGVAVTVSTGF